MKNNTKISAIFFLFILISVNFDITDNLIDLECHHDYSHDHNQHDDDKEDEHCAICFLNFQNNQKIYAITPSVLYLGLTNPILTASNETVISNSSNSKSLLQLSERHFNRPPPVLI